MLTTVRADAQDRLARSGEAIAMRWAHAYQVLAVAEEAERRCRPAARLEALDRLEEAHDDIRESLEWAMSQGDGTFALRLARGAGRVLADARPPHGGSAAPRRGAVDGGRPAAGRRRKALSGAGLLASYQGDYRLGEAYLREALAIAREQGDEEAEAIVLNWLGTNAYGAGDLNAAEAFASESARDAAPDRRARRDRARAQRARRRPPLPRRPRPRARDVRGEPRAQGGAAQRQRERHRGLADQPRPRRARRRAGPEAAEAAFKEAIEIWERTGDKQRRVGGRPQRRAARARPGPVSTTPRDC